VILVHHLSRCPAFSCFGSGQGKVESATDGMHKEPGLAYRPSGPAQIGPRER